MGIVALSVADASGRKLTSGHSSKKIALRKRFGKGRQDEHELFRVGDIVGVRKVIDDFDRDDALSSRPWNTARDANLLGHERLLGQSLGKGRIASTQRGLKHLEHRVGWLLSPSLGKRLRTPGHNKGIESIFTS